MLPIDQTKLVQKRLASMRHSYDDKDKAIAAVKHLYKLLGEGEPVVLWLPSPVACSQNRILSRADLMTKFPRSPRGMTSKLKRDLRFSTREARRADLRGIEALTWYRGSFSLPILGNTLQRASLMRSLYLGIAAMATNIPMTNIMKERLEAWEQVYLRCHFAFLRKDIVAVSEPPVIYLKDAEGRFHAEDGAAIVYSDGASLFFWHGVMVPRWVIKQPQKINPHVIFSQGNTEIRRVMIERYGMERFLEKSEARLLNKSGMGELYEVGFWRDNTWARFVKVKNSTPEPDGSYKHYVLQVHPDTLTAAEGVAWTFGFRNQNTYMRALEQET